MSNPVPFQLLKKKGKARAFPFRVLQEPYCNGLSPIAQLGEGPALTVPAVLKRITPEASVQNER